MIGLGLTIDPPTFFTSAHLRIEACTTSRHPSLPHGTFHSVFTDTFHFHPARHPNPRNIGEKGPESANPLSRDAWSGPITTTNAYQARRGNETATRHAAVALSGAADDDALPHLHLTARCPTPLPPFPPIPPHYLRPKGPAADGRATFFLSFFFIARASTWIISSTRPPRELTQRQSIYGTTANPAFTQPTGPLRPYWLVPDRALERTPRRSQFIRARPPTTPTSLESPARTVSGGAVNLGARISDGLVRLEPGPFGFCALVPGIFAYVYIFPVSKPLSPFAQIITYLYALGRTPLLERYAHDSSTQIYESRQVALWFNRPQKRRQLELGAFERRDPR
ncbi:hypothetical protein C8R47DRAFT_1193527 [Mycena vitilis]|nr:hypothetical protein C8R47DRAFT_1193527 [Mycena vitilis]